MPLGFGNAVVLQTMFSQSDNNYIIGCAVIITYIYILLVALVSNLPESQMAIGTGFAQLLKGLGLLN